VQGQEDPETLTAMDNLALTYQRQGRLKEAEELRVKEFEVCQRVLGKEHPDTLTSMHNFALIFMEQGRYEEATALMEDCIRMLLVSQGVHTID
jgi:Tfp pilus assembly protein PilF